MSNEPRDAAPVEDPEGRLEQAFIEEFLRARGYDAAALRALADEPRERLMKEASTYAALKLAEVEARAHFVHEIHGDS